MSGTVNTKFRNIYHP